jgi:hypothetical protein
MKHLRFTYSLIIGLTLIAGNVAAQKLDYDATLAKAVQHRNNQLISHTILWGYDKNAGTDRFSFDQNTHTMTLIKNKVIIHYDIQVIGTYDFKDSTFLWSTDNASIHKDLTKAARSLQEMAGKNQWNIPVGRTIKSSFRRAKEWQTLAFYLDNANGMEHVVTNGNRTAVLYLFYQVRIKDRMNKLFNNTVSNKTQYTLVADTSLVNYVRRYLQVYQENEIKFEILKGKNKNINYYDSLAGSRNLIARTYWDTTNISFRRQSSYGPAIRDHKAVRNWHVITISDTTRYVIAEEPMVYGATIYTFEITKLNNIPKINNIYANTFNY